MTQQHTVRGHHASQEIPFPDWLPAEVTQAASLLDAAAALAALGSTFVTNPKPRKGR